MSLAVLCPGQGGQSPTMFDRLEGEPAARRTLDGIAADGFDAMAAARGDRFANAIAQPLICTVQLATWSALAVRLEAVRVAPSLFAGYSVGELAAHGCAGSLPADATVRLAGERAAAMDAASGDDDGLGAVRGLSRATLERIAAAHGVALAIVNGDDHAIVGGPSAGLDATLRDAAMQGATVQRLPVRVAAHTPSLAAASAAFRARLTDAAVADPRVPVLGGIDGSTVRRAAAAIDALSAQISTTIRWDRCMDAVVEHGATVVLELGPGDALARMFRDRHPQVAARAVTDFRSVEGVADWVAQRLR